VRASRVRSRVAASVIAVALGGVATSVSESARAGGFELPDLGAQALGRGATFVAKADDGTAMYYNPAGLARQRGTRLYAGGNLYLHSFEFQRAGSFPDDPNDTNTPWGGKPYPAVDNSAGPFFTPFLVASTDFASFDRLTVAVGVFTPSTIGNRTFPLAIRNAPAASRYDFIQSRSSIIYPTLSGAYRVTPWLDLGVSAHLVLAKFDQTTVSYADLGQCPNVEYQPCDSRGTLVASATSFAATFGALARPTRNFAFGLSVRTPISLTAQGTFTPEAPKIANVQLQPGAATLTTSLPLIIRGGARYIAMDGDFEVYDLELDGTYEGWSAAQGTGPEIQIPNLGTFTNIDTLIVHGYSDTYSARLGGAYNFQAFDGVLTVRAGGFFDSSATGSFTYTRLDFDTLTKIAGTLGFGYRHGAFGVDLGYAAVASVPRLVGTNQGDVRPINGSKNGKPLANDGTTLPAVNEGAYRGFTNIFSIGLTVTFDELWGAARPFHYGNSYEPGYVGPGDGPKEEKKDDKKDADKPPSDREDKKPDEPKPADKKPDAKPEVKPEPKPEKKPDRPPPPKKKEWWEDPDS
jgi:long-chain fatty acid transport protein